MSKSLGNFFYAARFAGEGFTGREIRYSLLTAHYPRDVQLHARRFAGRARGAWRGLTNASASCAKQPERRPPARHEPLEFIPRYAGLFGDTLKRELQPAGSEIGAPNDLVARFTAALDDDLKHSAAWAVALTGCAK